MPETKVPFYMKPIKECHEVMSSSIISTRKADYYEPCNGWFCNDTFLFWDVKSINEWLGMNSCWYSRRQSTKIGACKGIWSFLEIKQVSLSNPTNCTQQAHAVTHVVWEQSPPRGILGSTVCPHLSSANIFLPLRSCASVSKQEQVVSPYAKTLPDILVLRQNVQMITL